MRDGQAGLGHPPWRGGVARLKRSANVFPYSLKGLLNTCCLGLRGLPPAATQHGDLGLYWDNGKEDGNYRDYWSYIRVTLGLY